MAGGEGRARPAGSGPGGLFGVVGTPLVIVWRCRLDVLGYAAAGQRVEVPAPACPACGRRLVRWSGYWRWARAEHGGEVLLWVRRGRCAACRRSHALVPDFLVKGRLDDVEAIGRGIVLAASGVGLRRVATRIGVPYTTARSWWRRFRARAPTLTAGLVALAVGLDGMPVDLGAVGAAAAVDALAVAWERARTRFGEAVGGPWAFWSRVTGGAALGTTTTVPWAAASGAAWMAPSL